MIDRSRAEYGGSSWDGDDAAGSVELAVDGRGGRPIVPGLLEIATSAHRHAPGEIVEETASMQDSLRGDVGKRSISDASAERSGRDLFCPRCGTEVRLMMGDLGHAVMEAIRLQIAQAGTMLHCACCRSRVLIRQSSRE